MQLRFSKLICLTILHGYILEQEGSIFSAAGDSNAYCWDVVCIFKGKFPRLEFSDLKETVYLLN